MTKPVRPILSTSVSRRVDADSNGLSGPIYGAAKLPQKKPGGKPGRRQLEQHEASLIPSIRSKTPISIVLLDGCRLEDVTPVGFDRYTIAVEYDGFRETVFKSAIARLIMTSEV